MNIPSRLPHTVGVIPDMCDNERVVVLRVPGKIAKECTIEDAGSGEPVLRVVGKAVSWSGQKRAYPVSYFHARLLTTVYVQVSRLHRAHRSSTCLRSTSTCTRRFLRVRRA
jgi:hypothetical protein